MIHEDSEIESELVKYISNNINKQNLRNKLIDIYKFKMGGTENRQLIYMTRKMCDHASNKRRMKGS